MINIGDRPAADFGDPLGVLGDCHRRIERFLRALIAVTEQALGGALNPEQRDAMEQALRYFREAAPTHTADEEDSLFPHLRSCEHPEARRVLAKLAALERDHEEATRMHTEVDRLGRGWLRDGRLGADEVCTLAGHLHTLDDIYRRHIAVEDNDVFPLARRVLPRPMLAAVGRAMALRRGLS